MLKLSSPPKSAVQRRSSLPKERRSNQIPFLPAQLPGHITARDPEDLDHFWVNPFGMHFGQIRVSDLILVNHRGELVEGRHAVNVAAFAIHSQVHAARPDVIAAAQ